MSVVSKLQDFVLGLKPEISRGSGGSVLMDKGKDIKIKLDVELNRKIVDFLRKNFDYDVLSEEESDGEDFTEFESFYWIVDPLDGSLNYSRGIPLYCVSIALWKGMEPVLGVIFDHNRGELFMGGAVEVAELGIKKGACRNGERVHVSDRGDMADGVLASGFPSFRGYTRESLLRFVDRVRMWKKVRLFGSAALSLAWVACGRCDAYVEEDIRIWDVAAGLAIVKAAGGEVNVGVNKKRKNFVTAVATNGKIKVGDVL
ncbi:MAG: inositol monophosphatase [Candidatus Marinimicrobia bacterium]|nr:inositol monophosphatase [Candidatus Neomarinimicrobiota bacterium]